MDFSISIVFMIQEVEEGFVVKRTFSFKTIAFLVLFMEEKMGDV